MSMSMSRRAAALLSTAALAVGLAGPVSAHETGEPHPEFIEERTYFECDGTTKVYNVNRSQLGEVPGWSTTAPAQSVQQGAGCGYADAPSLNGTAIDPTFTGTFTGNLADLAIEVHVIAPQLALYRYGVRVTVTIDGVQHERQTIDQVPMTVSDTGASYSTTFAVNGIDLIDDPEGPGTEEHDITIVLEGAYIDTNNVAMVWGTTEVPAGITFNADTTGMPAIEL